MKILHSEIAQKGDAFTKGDRVAVDAERGKGHHTAKSWWLGTVLRIEGTKIVIKHDDDGESDSYPFSRSQTDHFLKLPRATKRIAKDLTRKEVQALLPVPKAPAVTPKSKPVVKTLAPTTVKPAIAPRPADDSLFQWIKEARWAADHLALEKVLTEAQYRASPWLGVRKSTGRLSSTTSQAVTIGVGNWKKNFHVISVPTGKETVLYSREAYGSYDPEQVSKEIGADMKVKATSNSQMDYRAFCNLRLRASEFIKGVYASRRERDGKALDNVNKHYDKIAVGKQVLIEFTNGTTWKTIQAVDFRKNAVGISGSGSKLRWISFAHVKDVRDKPF